MEQETTEHGQEMKPPSSAPLKAVSHEEGCESESRVSEFPIWINMIFGQFAVQYPTGFAKENKKILNAQKLIWLNAITSTGLEMTIELTRRTINRCMLTCTYPPQPKDFCEAAFIEKKEMQIEQEREKSKKALPAPLNDVEKEINDRAEKIKRLREQNPNLPWAEVFKQCSVKNLNPTNKVHKVFSQLLERNTNL